MVSDAAEAFYKDLAAEAFYKDLYDALKNGEFSWLRLCGCRRFFICKDQKEKFCSDKCKNDFHSAERGGAYYRDWRVKRKRAPARRD
jgi:hypothetical protein